MKAVNADLINRHLQLIHLRWEGGRVSCAPLLDGFSWGKLGPNRDLGPVGSEHSDAWPACRSCRT
eukprot:4352308-Alexandrium_andersonii.AAC.1